MSGDPVAEEILEELVLNELDKITRRSEGGGANYQALAREWGSMVEQASTTSMVEQSHARSRGMARARAHAPRLVELLGSRTPVQEGRPIRWDPVTGTIL